MAEAAAIPPHNPYQPTMGSSHSKQHCQNPLQRREWRTLSTDEKQDYIEAVQCFQSKPAINPTIKASKSRFDEFQSYHISIADSVHFVGQFLPWHRLFLKYYEEALRNECEYSGAHPYWDWTLDSGSDEDFLNSPIWDPETGFGGNGVPGTYTLPPYGNDSRIRPDEFVGCVQDGPFADYTLSLGPGKLVTNHCLVRGFNSTAARIYLTASQVANTTSQISFEEFRIQLEGGSQTLDRKLHDSGHTSVGGDMSNFYSSPGDPIFYLHHANLDRIWWFWQNLKPAHMYDVSGRSSAIAASPPNVTLEFPLLMGNLGKTVTIRDVIDIHSDENCYTYI
ncbi:tyrosinase [Agrocybe pediades]|nr:tyrosinase [Agrocybe pediades]